MKSFLLSSGKIFATLSLLFIKLIIGFSIGIIIDSFLIKRQRLNNKEETEVECCHHNHHHTHEKHKVVDVLLHNFFHALEVFIYVLIVNVIFGTIIYYVGEDNIRFFLEENRYLSPLFATIIGVIPNCASSIILAELFIEDLISFGSLLAGLIINAGLGIIYLFCYIIH